MSVEYTSQYLERLIPLGSRVRLKWNDEWIEGIVTAHNNIDEHDSEDYDWPEDACCADLMSVEVFHIMDNWWFETDESEFWINGEWYTFSDVISGRKLLR